MVACSSKASATATGLVLASGGEHGLQSVNDTRESWRPITVKGMRPAGSVGPGVVPTAQCWRSSPDAVSHHTYMAACQFGEPVPGTYLNKPLQLLSRAVTNPIAEQFSF